MSGFNFYHSGDLGDIIYSLPTIKALGGGKLILGNKLLFDKNKPEKTITLEIVSSLSKILNQQYYIEETLFEGNFEIDYNLNRFRGGFVDWENKKLSVDCSNELRKTNLVKLVQNCFSIPGNLYLDNWLNCDDKIFTKKIVINRTFKYRNVNFPWQKILDKYKKFIVFLGHKDEYIDFANSYGDIDYIENTSMLDCFEIINGCKLFIGNQSFLYSLAEGLKVNCLQETDTYMCNCMYLRKDAYITNTLEKLNFVNIEKFIIKNLLK